MRSAPLRPWSRSRPGFLLLVAIAAGCGDGPTQTLPRTGPIDLTRPWVTSSAQAEGFDPVGLAAAFDSAAGLPSLQALLVVRNGRIVRERYFNLASADWLFDVRSVTKTVTGLLVGIAHEDGLLGLDDSLGDWFPEDSLRPEHDPIRVRHLLTMTSGMAWSDSGNFGPWWGSGRPTGYVLDRPVVAAPGDRFIYNTGTTHLLGQVVEAATNTPIPDFADARLFEPLGIRERYWLEVGNQTSTGAGLALRARDLARLGQFVLQRGHSGRNQIVSEAWMIQAFSEQVALGPQDAVLTEGGYGYQVWTESSTPRGAVMWGYGGQFVWVVPDLDLVVVGTQDWYGAGYSEAWAQADALARIIRTGILTSAR